MSASFPFTNVKIVDIIGKNSYIKKMIQSVKYEDGEGSNNFCLYFHLEISR